MKVSITGIADINRVLREIAPSSAMVRLEPGTACAPTLPRIPR